MQTKSRLKDGITGAIVADALGVPFEFKSRAEMKANPARDMVGYRTWNQSPGTWSDDSSLMLCLAESLTKGYDLINIATLFVNWKTRAIWTAHTEVFDIGDTTRNSLNELEQILSSEKHAELKMLRYSATEQDNGNGSLMRILPLLYLTKDFNIKDTFETVWMVSALTHKHIRAALCCFIYLQIAKYILNKKDKIEALDLAISETNNLFKEIDIDASEKEIMGSILTKEFLTKDEEEILSNSYVVNSLEASLYCFYKNNSYESSVLHAVNLGDDTDTTACITGGLAGLYYGIKNIPKTWYKQTARINEITELCSKLERKY